MTTTLILSILFRALLLVVCGTGVSHALFRKSDEFMGAGGILYYAIQSNLWVMLMTAVYLVLSAFGVSLNFRVLEVARFVVLVGITITFLIFWAVLAPKMEKEYLLSMNNFLVHTLAPLLFIADFFLFDRIMPLHAAEVLWSLVMPMYYLVFSIAHAAVNPNLRFQDGSRYPYFFMDTDKYGWFGFRNGPGVFWWCILLTGLTLGLGYFYRFLLTIV